MSVIERMENIGNKAGKLFGDMMRFTFQSHRIYVEICLDMGAYYGRTICNFYGVSKKNKRIGRNRHRLTRILEFYRRKSKKT